MWTERTLEEVFNSGGEEGRGLVVTKERERVCLVDVAMW